MPRLPISISIALLVAALPSAFAGEAAKRVIVRAVKGSKAPLVLTPGLVLHTADGGYLPEIDAVLRNGAALPAV